MERITWLLEGAGSGGAAVFAALLFLALGVVVARLLGVRGALSMIVAALPVGIGLLTLTTEVLGRLGVQTSLLVDAAATLLVAAAVWLARRWRGRAAAGSQADLEPGWLPWAGAGVGALLGTGAWLAGIGRYTLPPQANDDIWHGYLVERLTQMPLITAGTVAPTAVDAAQPVWHYPYGIHLAQALVRDVTSISVPEILNGAWLVDVGVLLPLGLAALAWRVWPARPWVAFWSGFMASGVTVFPFLTNGVFPYTVALVMIPGFIALLLGYLRQAGVPASVMALSAVGIFVTHPLAAVVAAVLAIPLVAEDVLRRWPVLALVETGRRLLIVAAVAAIGSLPWLLNGEPTVVLAPIATVGGLLPAVTMFVTLASPWTPPQYLLAILVGLGVVASLLGRRGIGLTVGFLIFGSLFVCDLAAVPATATITGVFLGWYRLLAVVGLTLPILAALGVVSIVEAARWALDRIAPAWSPRGAVAVALAVGVVAGTMTIYGVARGQSIVRTAWHSSGLITADDVTLFRALKEDLGPADRVLNSPRDGSTWMFALVHATPVIPYVTPGSMDWAALYAGPGEPADPGAACRRLQSAGVTHAIVKTIVGDVGDFDIAGFVSRNPDLFRLVTSTGSGAIYQIDRQVLDRCASS